MIRYQNVVLVLGLTPGCSSPGASSKGTPLADAAAVSEAAAEDAGAAEDSPPTPDAGGKTQDAAGQDAGPQKIDGNPSNPQSCDTVCSSHGLSCDDTTTWEDEGEDPSSASYEGGAHEWYVATDSTLAPHTDPCSTAPRSVFIDETSRQYMLQSFRCGCR